MDGLAAGSHERLDCSLLWFHVHSAESYARLDCWVSSCPVWRRFEQEGAGREAGLVFGQLAALKPAVAEAAEQCSFYYWIVLTKTAA